MNEFKILPKIQKDTRIALYRGNLFSGSKYFLIILLIGINIQTKLTEHIHLPKSISRKFN